MTVVYRSPAGHKPKSMPAQLQWETLGELLQEQIPDVNKQGNIWNYEIWSPLSLDDRPVITVYIWYGTTKAEHKRSFTIELGKVTEIK